MNKNLAWINYAKTFCILIVYYYHSECYCGFNKSLLYNFYSPFFLNVFFVISGYLLYRKHEQNNSSNNSHRIEATLKDQMVDNVLFKIIIPTILFSSIFVIPKCLLQHEFNDYLSIIYYALGGSSSWFTYALAISEIIIILLWFRWNSNPITTFVVSIGLFFFGVFTHYIGIQNLFSFQSGLVATPILALGCLLFKYENLIDKYIYNWISIIGLAIIFIFIVLSNYGGCHFSSYGIDFNISGGLAFLTSALVLLGICQTLGGRSEIIANFVGRNTLPFYFLCNAVPNISAIIIKKIIDSDSYYLSVLTFVVSICISSILVYIIITYFSFLLDFRKINRFKK